MDILSNYNIDSYDNLIEVISNNNKNVKTKLRLIILFFNKYSDDIILIDEKINNVFYEYLNNNFDYISYKLIHDNGNIFNNNELKDKIKEKLFSLEEITKFILKLFTKNKLILKDNIELLNTFIDYLDKKIKISIN